MCFPQWPGGREGASIAWAPELLPDGDGDGDGNVAGEEEAEAELLCHTLSYKQSLCLRGRMKGRPRFLTTSSLSTAAPISERIRLELRPQDRRTPH